MSLHCKVSFGNAFEYSFCKGQFQQECAQVVRAPIRFARKFYAAQLLHARVFGGQQAVDETLQDIKESALFQNNDSKLKDLMKLDTSKLQQWVRGSCLQDPMATHRYKVFVHTVVKPCLSVNVARIPDNLHDMIGRITCVIRGQEASEEDHIRLKIACSALRGELTQHPLIAGLALSCGRMLERESRGIFTMRGRRKDTTEREDELLKDAGLQLALAGGNSALALQFGLSGRACHINVDELREFSLPTPCLALAWPEKLAENFQLADQRFAIAPGVPQSALDQLDLAFCCAIV